MLYPLIFARVEYTYALDDGELLWEQPLPSNVGRMYVDGERLKMSGYVERQPAFLEFNIHTGEPLGNMAEIRPDGRLIALSLIHFASVT